MKLIVSCYSCSPTRGSEPGMGWGYLRAAAQQHDIWALVDGWEFEAELTAYREAHAEELERVRFIFIPNKPRPLLRKIWPPSYYWFYNLWHRRAYKIAQRFHAEIHFDAAWKLSMVSFREPGYLWKLSIPFIWGPVGALGYTDVRLFPLVGLRGGAEYLVRNIINWCHAKFLYRPRLAAIKAASCGALIAATGENGREMKRLWGVDSLVMPEIGLEKIQGCRKNQDTIRLVWVGQFTYGKALPILLRALALIKDQLPKDWALDVIGDGRCAGKWKMMAENFSLAAHITWHGWVGRDESFSIQQKANVSIITSIRDLTSTALIESLACGNPVVCIDHCGFSDVVDQSCGIKIPVARPSKVVKGFAIAILALENQDIREERSRGAILKARRYLWSAKVEQLLPVLDHAMVANQREDI